MATYNKKEGVYISMLHHKLKPIHRHVKIIFLLICLKSIDTKIVFLFFYLLNLFYFILRKKKMRTAYR